MKIRIVIPLENINVDAGVELEGFRIMNGYDFLYSYGFDTKNFITHYGNELEVELRKLKILYYEGLVSENPLTRELPDTIKVIQNVSNYFSYLLDLLWLQKDNSAYLANVYLEEIDTNSFVSRRGYEVTSSKACECSSVYFSQEELMEGKLRLATAQKYLNRYGDNEIPTPIFENGIEPQASGFTYYTFSRIVRTYDFLRFARTQLIPVIKTTFYVAIYECLFTSGTSELTHQVSERASLFIGGTKEEKQGNYNLLKEAYSIRSRYIHGDTINKGREYFISILDPLDELTRKVFNKVLDEPDIFQLSSSDGDKKKFEQYFKDLIFK